MSIKDLLQHALEVSPVGSRVTCNPPPSDTDRDWLVLIEQADWGKFDQDATAKGFVLGGSICYDESPLPVDHQFCSYKTVIDGVVENIIVTHSPEFHRRFLAASSVAKKFNLLEKADRVALFQAVLYGNEVPA